jgi:primosomal protein N' (replication factor Y)
MLVEVALPVPLPRTFTYRLDGPAVAPGTRVRVRFGPRQQLGWVVAESTAEPPPRLRTVEAVLDEEPTVPPDLLRLCRWIADYYLCPIGQVLRAALPAVLSDTAREDPHVRTRRVLRLSRELPSLLERDQLFGRARRQRECYEFVEATGGSADFAHLTGQLGFSESVLRGLVERGFARVEDEAVARDPFSVMALAEPATLVPTPAQTAAIAALQVAAAEAQALSRGAADTGPRRHGDTATSGDPDAAATLGGEGTSDPAGALGRPVAASPRRRVVASPESAQAPPEPIPPFLLRGVTGSGKTLVYIELLKEVVERQGRGAIVLVPEIALTPQTVSRFRAHFGDAVAVLHSALSDGERYDAWRALWRGDKRIAVGARSAVFAPLADVGAIVIDEEHEGSYKQSEAPRYHAREVAIMRARLTGAVCLLGSATPSLESWQNAARGKFRLLELPERVEGRPLPPVRVVDMRNRPDPGPGDTATRGHGDTGRPGVSDDRPGLGSPAASGPAGASGRPVAASPGPRVVASASGSDRVLSDPLIDAIEQRLQKGEQTILLLNRRGYSTFVQCRDCGAVWRCRNCNVSLTYHRAHRRMVCHYCFHEEPPPVTCDACGSADISFRGIGTEQVERTVAETFPGARLARMDVDTTSAKWSHHEILSRVERGEVDILLGTQMIAKGLDFPRVTLVGVINADVGMNLPDFRASERTFQLLTQVSGRAGRGELGGEVLVQTALPGHYAVRAALEHDFLTFAARELEERRGPGYPPHSRLLNIVVSGTAEEAVQLATDAAAAWAREAIARQRAGAVSLLGPAPCAVDRIRNRWRWHFLLRSTSARELAAVGRQIHHRYTVRPGAAELRLVLDRDPISLL